MIKAVICDIDGTLVDSNALHAAAWRDAFLAAGYEIPQEAIHRQIGKGGDELIPVFIPWWRSRHIAEPLKKYRGFLFRQDYLAQVRPFPQVRELLLRMRGAGLQVSVATSAHREELDDYLRIANIADLIEESSSADDADRAKPHPDIFAATLKKLGVKPEEALALGDTPYDAEAAGKAGVLTVGVTSGGWSHEKLLEAGCVEIYRDAADLLANFDRSAFKR